MGKWRVQLSATIANVWADVEVEADSQEEAERKAVEKAAALSIPDWETGDGVIEDIQTDGVFDDGKQNVGTEDVNA